MLHQRTVKSVQEIAAKYQRILWGIHSVYPALIMRSNSWSHMHTPTPTPAHTNIRSRDAPGTYRGDEQGMPR